MDKSEWKRNPRVYYFGAFVLFCFFVIELLIVSKLLLWGQMTTGLVEGKAFVYENSDSKKVIRYFYMVDLGAARLKVDLEKPAQSGKRVNLACVEFLGDFDCYPAFGNSSMADLVIDRLFPLYLFVFSIGSFLLAIAMGKLKIIDYIK